mmetsp:Transcript_14359/g.17736  ORF Transcript_14359/g.17736 Transcript_14359/m.17736 type:complete len:97 (+) Transcript_14359:576-866(+)
MDNMLGYHMKQGQSNGCPALKHAYEKLKKEQPYFGPVKILEEARITNETRSDYLGNPSLQNGSGPGCNWVVRDNISYPYTLLFFSRIVGFKRGMCS